MCFRLWLNFTDGGNLFIATSVAPAESFRRPVLHATLASVQVGFANAPVSVGTQWLTSRFPDPIVDTGIISQRCVNI